MIILIALFILSATPAAAQTPLAWERIPGTAIRPLCPSGIPGASGCRAVTEAWNGGVFDTKRNRLIIWGGGHNDYYGNEIYALDTNLGLMQRLTEPGRPVAPGTCAQGTPDCAWTDWIKLGCMRSIVNGTQPNSRHTYDGVVYAANVDKLFAFGGSLACSYGAYGNDAWVFDFSTNTWNRIPLTQQLYETPGVVAVYDPAIGLVYIHDRLYLYAFNPYTYAISRISSRAPFMNYYLTGVVDPVRRILLLAGGGQAWTVDLTAINANVVPLSSTGGAAIVNSGYPGLVYDPVNGKILGWNGGNTLYSLDLDTKIWTPIQTTGGPTALRNGTYKRFSYDPSLHALISYNSINENAAILRLPRPQTPPTDMDFAQRCTAPGVFRCYNFDKYGRGESISPDNLYPDSYGVIRAALDTSVKVSGAGSLRFWSPSKDELAAEGKNLTANINGQWSMHGIGGAFPAQGPGSTFYVQVRFRASPGMLSNKQANSSWKWFEIINGNSVCGTEGVVFVNYYMTGLMTGYTDCGARGLNPENDGKTIPPYRFQQSDEPDGYNCWYGSTSSTGCFYLQPDTWYTFLFKINIGTWNQKNSSVEGWVAPLGATSWRKLYDTKPFTLKARTTSMTLNNIVLTGYMTKLSAGWVTPGYMWYDELIVSAQPIALPGAGLIMPQSPSGLTVRIGDNS